MTNDNPKSTTEISDTANKVFQKLYTNDTQTFISTLQNDVRSLEREEVIHYLKSDDIVTVMSDDGLSQMLERFRQVNNESSLEDKNIVYAFIELCALAHEYEVRPPIVTKVGSSIAKFNDEDYRNPMVITNAVITTIEDHLLLTNPFGTPRYGQSRRH